MTLTYPVLNRARRILWIVTGREKAPILTGLVDGDESIPATGIRLERALLIPDEAGAPAALSSKGQKENLRCE